MYPLDDDWSNHQNDLSDSIGSLMDEAYWSTHLMYEPTSDYEHKRGNNQQC